MTSAEINDAILTLKTEALQAARNTIKEAMAAFQKEEFRALGILVNVRAALVLVARDAKADAQELLQYGKFALALGDHALAVEFAEAAEKQHYSSPDSAPVPVL